MAILFSAGKIPDCCGHRSDEIATQPELISRLANGQERQTQLGLDNRAECNAALTGRPRIRHKSECQLPAIKLHQHLRGNVEVLHLRMLDVAHTLVVTDCASQERHDHGAAISDVAIKQYRWVSDLHHALYFINEINQRVHALVKSSVVETSTLVPVERFSGKVRCRFKIAVALSRAHMVGYQNVLAVLIRSASFRLRSE